MTPPYTRRVLRYAITAGKSYAGNYSERLDLLLRQIAQWTAVGIDLVQLREKDLAAGQLMELTRQVIAAVAETQAKTRVLVNSRVDIAVAAGAHGVHLTAASGELTPAQVRQVFQTAGRPEPVLSASCHTLEQVRRAAESGVDAILFGPVFGKYANGSQVVPATGLERLRRACAAAGQAQVFALGGVTDDRAADCLRAGAAGVAGIRLFQSFPHQ